MIVWKTRIQVYILRAVAVVILAGLWLYAVGPAHVAELLLPTPSDVGSALGSLVTGASLWDAALLTVVEIIVASTLATLCGLLYGFVGARRVSIQRVLEPLVSWGYMTPFVLFYPLFLLMFGIGPSSKIGFAAVASFFPIAYSSLRAFSNVNSRYLRMGYAYGASRWQLDLQIKIPDAMPMVRAGIRIGIATAMITVIYAEMLGSTGGLGYLLARTTHTLDSNQAYALIVCILALALLAQVLLAKTLRRRGEEAI